MALWAAVGLIHGLLDLAVELGDDAVLVRVHARPQQRVPLLQQAAQVVVGALALSHGRGVLPGPGFLLLFQPGNGRSAFHSSHCEHPFLNGTYCDIAVSLLQLAAASHSKTPFYHWKHS